MRAFSAACGLWLKGAFTVEHPFYKQKGRRIAHQPLRLLATESGLLDRDLLALCGRLLGQRQLEHAVLEFGFGLGLVDFLRQREAACQLAVDALAVQSALVLRHFLLALEIRL